MKEHINQLVVKAIWSQLEALVDCFGNVVFCMLQNGTNILGFYFYFFLKGQQGVMSWLRVCDLMWAGTHSTVYVCYPAAL